MKKRNLMKKTNIRTYLLPLLTIVLLLSLAGYIIIRAINVFTIKHVMEDSNRLADSHTERLAISNNASKTINRLLDERILSTCNMVIKSADNISNQLLGDIAENLNVDEIYWYNSEGEIIYSANDYLGWKTGENDPIHDFMLASDEVRIDPIRPDLDSGIPTKYGYKKLSSGEFIQVGVLAENIDKITRGFCPQVFIDSIVGRDGIVHVYYLNNEGKTIFCDAGLSKVKDRSYVLDDLEREAIENDEKYYIRKTYKGMDTYEALLPIYTDNVKRGSLVIFYSLGDTNKLLRNMSLIILTFVGLIFFVYAIMVVSSIRKNREIENLIYYDRVTGLFSKEYFIEFMKEKLDHKNSDKGAIFVNRWKGFKMIKMVFGQEVLDGLLLEIANKLKSLGFNESLIFKYGENNFCIYVASYKDKSCLIDMNNKIIDSFDEISSNEEYEELVSSTLGILEISESSKDVNEIIRRIDIVSDKLEESGTIGYGFFDEAIQRDLRLTEIIEKELRKEIHNGFEGFYLEYQPQIDLKTNKIIGFEALARWNNGELGIVPPIEFIEIAERFHLITQLGYWIIEEAFRFLKELEGNKINDISISINISVIQLLHEDFIENLMERIEEYDISPSKLILEITESTVMNNYDIANKRLEILRKSGIRIAIDDFGTGYASLGRLRDLNIDILKIDKTFVDNLDVNKEDVFINSILLLAKELGLKTVAEGVEKKEQRCILEIRSCDIMQGYLFSRPVSSHKAIEIINKNKNCEEA